MTIRKQEWILLNCVFGEARS